MKKIVSRKGTRVLHACALAAMVSLTGTWLGAQSTSQRDTASEVQRALQKLPYYGVFDFLAFGVDRGTATLVGYAYRGNLKTDAQQAVKRVAGVDDVTNKIELLPASLHDDRIRWETFYRIYTDDFLSRYAPGGAMFARYETLSFARFYGMQPFGMYPIHIIVKNGVITLVGVVDNETDKTLAGIRAREVEGAFSVENELIVSKT